MLIAEQEHIRNAEPVARMEPKARTRASSTRYGEIRDPCRSRDRPAFRFAPCGLRGALRLAGGIFAQGGLGGGEAGDRNAEGRARDIVERDFVAEGDRGRVATVLAA